DWPRTLVSIGGRCATRRSRLESAQLRRKLVELVTRLQERGPDRVCPGGSKRLRALTPEAEWSPAPNENFPVGQHLAKRLAEVLRVWESARWEGDDTDSQVALLLDRGDDLGGEQPTGGHLEREGRRLQEPTEHLEGDLVRLAARRIAEERHRCA